MVGIVPLFLGLFLSIILGTISTAFGKEAIALVSSLTGNVEVRRAHQTTMQALHLGEELFEDDVLHTYENSRASLFFSDGSVITVFPNSRLALSLREMDKKESSLVASLSKRVMKGIGGVLSVEREQETLSAVPGIRKKIEEEEMGIRVLFPRNTMILTSRPRFHWRTGRETGAFAVSLTLKGMGGQLWTAHTEGTEISYPREKRALERGQTYFLKVESSNDASLYDEVYFRVLEDEKAKEVRQVIEDIEELQKLNPDDSTPHFILASFYTRKGLYHRALAELDALEKTRPGERFVLEQKRNIFSKIGFWKKWEEVNQKLNAL